MKIILEIILKLILLASGVVILAMTTIMTTDIWNGDHSLINYIFLISGMFGSTSLFRNALDVKL